MERYLRYQVIATKIGCTKGKDLLLGDIQCHSESYFVFSLFRNRTALTNACRHWYKTVFIKLCAPFTYVILSFRVRVPMLCAIIVEALNMHLKSNNWLAFLSNLTLVPMVLCQRPAPVSSRAHLLPTKKCSTHNRATIYLSIISQLWCIFSICLLWCTGLLQHGPCSLLFVPYAPTSSCEFV
jgi:hypothetical protein